MITSRAQALHCIYNLPISEIITIIQSILAFLRYERACICHKYGPNIDNRKRALNCSWVIKPHNLYTPHRNYGELKSL